MIDRTEVQMATPEKLSRDERSMRVVEYAMAFMALAAALLMSLR